MSALSIFQGVCKVLGSPLGIIEDWASEPLKRWEHKRQEESAQNRVDREIQLSTAQERVTAELAEKAKENDYRRQEQQRSAEHNRTLENNQQQAELAEQERNAAHERSMEEAKQKADLEIRLQTEINRINAETEEWKKDQEFERMKEVVEAVAQYQQTLSELNLKAVHAIGKMSIELRSEAQNLVKEKTIEYKRIQDEAMADLKNDLMDIKDNFSDEPEMKAILIDMAKEKCVNITSSTKKFLAELSEDIQRMNNTIDLLAQQGQENMDRLLQGFHAIQASQALSQSAQGKLPR